MIVVMLITAAWRPPATCSPPARSSRSGSCREDIARALRARRPSPPIGGVLNSFPYTCFAENVGLVRLTRDKEPLRGNTSRLR